MHFRLFSIKKQLQHGLKKNNAAGASIIYWPEWK